MSILRVKPNAAVVAASLCEAWRRQFKNARSASRQSGTTTNSNRRDRPADDKKILLVPIAREIGFELREIFLRRNFVAGQDANDLNSIAKRVIANLPQSFVFLTEMSEPAKFIDEPFLQVL